MLKALVYDIEIAKAVTPKKGDPLVNIDYCKGWDDFKGMGLAVCCAYDFVEDMLHVFCDDNISEFSELFTDRDIIIGFNNHRFDDKLLEALGVKIPAHIESYDILQAIYRSMGGWKPGLSGYTLNEVARVNLGLTKSLTGELAPVLWQRKEIGKVVRYCSRDVSITKKLFERIISRNGLLDDTNSERVLNVPLPKSLDKKSLYIRDWKTVRVAA